jgi:nitrate reductase assembly molybdenum cofactor insertion protein NarJ
MTAVIGRSAHGGYRDDMAVRDDIQRVASALEKPRRGYMKQLETNRTALVARFGEAARQLDVFADRITDLTIDELRELHDETFLRATLAEIRPLGLRLTRRPTSCGDARAALNTLAPMLDRLEADRNPFAHVVRALCCLLLARASHI